MPKIKKTVIIAEHYLGLISVLRDLQGGRPDLDLAAVSFAVISISQTHEADISTVSQICGIPRETVRRKVEILERDYQFKVYRRSGRTIIKPSFHLAGELVRRSEDIIKSTQSKLNKFS